MNASTASIALTAALSVAFLACGEDDRRGRGMRTNALMIVTATLPDIHIGQAYDQKIKVSGVSFDSRKVKKNYIFFAIEGQQTSGINCRQF